MPDILLHLALHIAAALLYAGLGFHFWQTRRSNSPISAQRRAKYGLERLVIAVALLLQGIGLYASLFSTGSLRFSFSIAFSLMLWLAVLIYWLESVRSQMEGLLPIVLPLAAGAALSPALFQQTHEIVHAASPGFKIHFLAAMLAYSLVTLSALHALFMGLIERKLHQNPLEARRLSAPPLLSMETMLFRLIGIAFLLLTLTLVSGVFFSEEVFGKAVTFDHKTVFAIASWGVFAALLIGRRIYGWRGRVAQRWTLAGFLLLFLAYIGTRFVSEIVLGRI